MTVITNCNPPFVKRALSEQPPFTIQDLQKAIPAHCFVRSTFKSSLYMVGDLLLIAALYYVASFIETSYVPSFARPLLWLVWGFAQGSAMTGIWVVAHECGHHAFSDSRLICDIVGLVLHSMLLVPYHSWRISHAKHHRSTSDLVRDEVFIPLIKNSGDKVTDPNGKPALSRVVSDAFTLLIFGWPGYLFSHVSGRNYQQHTDHFNPKSPLFSKDEYWLVVITDVALLVWLGFLSYLAFFVTTPLWVFKLYVIPYLVVNFWLVLYTKLHHTHVALPHYAGKEWNWLRGALATIDRDYGFFNLIHHHIGDTHIVHHLFSKMPHYHAQEATEAIKPILGKYYNLDTTPIAVSLWQTLVHCRYVENDNQQSGSIDGVYWFNPSTDSTAPAKSS